MSEPDRRLPPPHLSVVLPAYNEVESIGDVVDAVLAAVPEGEEWEIIVVDDGSTDGTAERAARPGVQVVRHPYNKGNGAAVKSGLRAAQAERLCLLDADGQHDPAEIPRLTEMLDDYDLVIGTRTNARGGGWIRRIGNLFYNRLASYLTNTRIPDLTSGFRAARRQPMLEFLPLYPNGFSYPVTSTLAFIKAGYNVGFAPIDVSTRVGRSKIRLFQDGIKFVLITLRIVTLFSPLRIFFPASLVLFVVGAGYGVYTIFTEVHITNTTVLLCLTSLLIFLIGLISEQIALMRFERKE